MTLPMRFEGVSLTVEDVARSLEFYRDRLGLEAVYVSLPAFAMLRHGGSTIGLLCRTEAEKEGVVRATPQQARGVHLEFTTDDLDALYATLLAAGVEFDEPPHDEPWERAMTAFDPDGHSVEFAQGKRGSHLKPPAP